jgi:allantoinase
VKDDMNDQPYDLVITGGIVVNAGEILAATIAVRDGKIAGLLSPTEAPPARKIIDASGMHIFPGLVDTHVHLRDPGHTEREDFTTGTRAAACGGITTILEMPISTPTVNSAQVFRDRLAIVGPKAVVDFALYGAAGHENLDEIAPMAAEGAVAYKTFLHAPMPGREHEFVGLWCVDEGRLRDLMFEVAKTGVPHTFHCENNAMLHALEAKLVEQGRIDPMAHAEMRPTVVEDVSVATMLALAAETKGHVQVVHMSSPRAAQLVKEAKARGVNVTAETCPHYLFLSEDELRAFGPYAKCNPVLRSNEDREAFWEYVKDGTIDVIGSDHAPYIVEEKERGTHDIFKAPSGFPGLDIQFPLMLTAYHDGRLSLSDIARLTATRAAELFHLPQKGRIAAGLDADLAIVDLEERWEFDLENSMSKARDIMRVYHGRKLHGKVKTTIVRGTTVYDGGKILVEPGFGIFVTPVIEPRRATAGVA